MDCAGRYGGYPAQSHAGGGSAWGEEASTFVGLDVQKETIDVTIVEAGAAGEVRHFGSIGGDLEAIAKLL